MNNLILTKEEQDKFYEDGYVVLEPNRMFSELEIEAMRSECDELFPDWNEGFGNEKKRKTNYSLHGTAKNYSGISKDLEEFKKNKFFAKRSSIIAPKYSQLFVNVIENKNLLDVNKLLLKCEELSLHNSAIACVYPGAVQEPGTFHVDTTGFTNDPLGAVRNNDFVLNTFVYLSDVDETTAPLRVIPGTAKKYLDINKQIAQSFRSKDSVSNLGQLNIFEEILPENLPKPVLITGKAGTVTLMSGHVLHSATTNSNNEKCRYTLAINLANRKSPYFYKDYSVYAKDCSSFIEKFSDKGIPRHTYFNNSISINFKFKKFLKTFKSKMAKIVRRSDDVSGNVNNDLFIVSPPWRKSINLNPSRETLYWANSLARKSKQENLNDIKNTSALKIVLAIPNTAVFLSKYYEKDFIFFKCLPMKNYFVEESLRRYVTRYFSGIVSSFATEEELKNIFSSEENIFFENLSALEGSLLSRGVKLSLLELDSTFSRYTIEELDAIFVGAGFQKKINDRTDSEILLNYLNGESSSWIVASYSKHND